MFFVVFCFFFRKSFFRMKKQESFRKTFTSALLTMPKPLTVWITANWKILKEKGIPHHLTCLLRNLYAGQETTVRTGQGTTDWFQIGKEYVKAVYSHPACLTSMQSTSWEAPRWMKHQLESRLLGEISITSDMQMIPPLSRMWRGTQKPLDDSESGQWKS